MYYLYGRINWGHRICELCGGCPLFREGTIRGFTVYLLTFWILFVAKLKLGRASCTLSGLSATRTFLIKGTVRVNNVTGGVYVINVGYPEVVFAYNELSCGITFCVVWFKHSMAYTITKNAVVFCSLESNGTWTAYFNGDISDWTACHAARSSYGKWQDLKIKFGQAF